MRRLAALRAFSVILLSITLLGFAGVAFAMPSLPGVSFSMGMSGEDVISLQAGLNELGLYHGPVDGQYGEGTASAVRRLQRQLGVSADGLFGPATAAAYEEAAANGSFIGQSADRVSPPILGSNALEGLVIGIDPGHQRTADMNLEPIFPGSTRTKERMSAGGQGVKTGIYEYEITLQIAAKLKTQLENAGAKVVMTRAKHDVSLSNAERAVRMNEARVDCWVRIHCDISADRDKSGVSALYPSETANAAISVESKKLAELVLDYASRETKANALGTVPKDDQTGFNWSERPVATIELGFLSNPLEDVRLNRSAYQESCALGVALGIAEYFGR